MNLEFDPNKSERNRRERGFGFGYAARIFLGRTLVSFARVEAGEVRMKAIGDVDGVIYTLSFVDRGDVRGIVSARPASRKE